MKNVYFVVVVVVVVVVFNLYSSLNMNESMR